MSGGNKKPDHYQAERQEAAQQNSSIDNLKDRAAFFSPPPPGSPAGFGKTNFEGYDLNQMIDIVESASPETLETAATALVDARDAINEAANELSRNLGAVDWEGEAHTAFYKWGMDLTTTAQALASYADEVGTQVLAAGSGLASVRKSMPPRDTRLVRKTVDEIPTPAQVDTNKDYAAAVKAEKDRQEAINQMYRLASFYTVSSGMMQLAEEPVFPKMPDVGVPPPPPGYGVPDEPPVGRGSLSRVADSGNSDTTGHQSVNTNAERPRAEELPTSQEDVGDPVVTEGRHVGTEIDTVGTLPSQDPVKPTTVTPPSTSGPSATTTGTVPPFAPGAVPPTFRGTAGRSSRFGGLPVNGLPTSAQGRVGGVPGGTAAGRTGTGPMGPMGRASTPGQAGGRGAAGPVGPMGRAPVTGQAGGRGAAGPVGPMGRAPVTGQAGGRGAAGPVGPMGRAPVTGQAGGRGAGPMGRGVVGGVPGVGGQASERARGVPRGTVTGMGATNPARPGAGRTGAGRTSDGVVGGRPVNGGVSGTNGSRLPRGTVVGGEGVPTARATGERPGQRGVIGTSGSTTGTGQAARRPVGSPEGVVGTPKRRASGSRNSGSTSGGAGVARGAARNQSSGEERSRRDERRDDASSTD
ncbi:WXG100 family type VII secretion target [Streptomyces bobili]|uniref:WXG100 family type VII secretion target n=1 Tax=Streptomyces bobili TaxID=67280 RepID=UPI0036FE78E1